MPGNMGNSNFYFLYGFVFGDNAATDAVQGAGMEILSFNHRLSFR